MATWTTPLPAGCTLHVTTDVPTTAAAARQHVRNGALYLHAGTIDTGHLAGYLGLSTVLDSTRPATSLTRWAIELRKITPRRIALLRPSTPLEEDLLRLVEARTIMGLSAAGITLLNTHSGAALASARLTRGDVIVGQHLATALTRALLTGVYRGHTNPYPSPSPNAREAAVKAVLHGATTRALDTREVLERMAAAGATTTGRTWEYSIRRDLRAREAETRGIPRIFSTIHRYRRVYWNPTALTKRAALRGYDRAHPLPKSTQQQPDRRSRRAA